MTLRTLILGLGVAVITAAATPANPVAMGHEAEESFELRMERVLRKGGNEKLLARLREEIAADPRPYAIAWLANYQLYGDLLGTPQVHNEPAGYAAAEQAMKAGSIFGKELVGRALGDGRTPDRKRNLPEATRLLLEAAEAGRYTAMGELAKYYLFGAGVPQNTARAETWARLAAYRGAPSMLAHFGRWLEDGTLRGRVDVDQACAYYFEAAQWGEQSAFKRLEVLAGADQKTAQKFAHLWILSGSAIGVEWTTRRLKQAVAELEQGWPDDPAVLVAVAQVRMERSLAVFNVKKAEQLLAKAAALGSTDARYHQSELLRRGIGRKKQPAESVRILRALADAGNTHALGRLGWLYYWGADESNTVGKDEVRAFQLTRDAAHRGDRTSVMNVAFCHMHGIGTPVDYYLAARYYSIAEDLGFVQAKGHKDSCLAAIKD